MYTNYPKRLLDLIISLMTLILLLPVLVLTAILLIAANKGNPFFFQKRPGKNEKIFLLVKFRTMNNKKNDRGELLPDEFRITRLGRWIRRSSIDELPQLFNVLNGDMSLVGPRPLLIEYLKLYNSRQKIRHLVRPGITGWAQVNGRNAITWEKKFELDVWYVENISFLLDCKIIWHTIKKVFVADGISYKNNATMPYFKGADSI